MNGSHFLKVCATVCLLLFAISRVASAATITNDPTEPASKSSRSSHFSVAAVHDRRQIPVTEAFGAPRAPLQEFCKDYLIDSTGQPVVMGVSEKSAVEVKVDLQLMDGRHIFFNPGATADLSRLLKELEGPIKSSKVPPKNATPREQSSLKQYRRGLQELRLLAQTILTDANPPKRDEWMRLMRETAAAIDNNWRPRVPKRVESITVLWLLLEQMQRPIGQGDAPAVNLQPGSPDDLSKLDPLPSTFWQRPAKIAAEDLFHGFGRTNWLKMDQKIANYFRAKDSFGANPGFEVMCDGVEVKLKFAEVSSEPFTARLFAALGFHADPTDYTPEAKVRYDRRIFTEFHSRQKLETRFTMFWEISFYTMSLQKHYDPFHYIQWAVLRDGTRWTGAELKQRLFYNVSHPHPEDSPTNFRPEVEARIEYLVTVPANVQAKDPLLKNVGPWDYAQLDHRDRRELRGAGLLAAWLGFFDTRFDNTKLRLLETPNGDRVVHYFSDLGGGMGETSGVLFQHGERPEKFPWTFTLPPLEQGPHHLARPLRITGFKPIAPTASFAAMTIDDARWMARLIGQLTEQQITDALDASGFDSATAKFYLEKLVSRRDHMIVDLGLGDEIPPLRTKDINRNFSFNPAAPGAVQRGIQPSVQIKPSINGQ